MIGVVQGTEIDFISKQYYCIYDQEPIYLLAFFYIFECLTLRISIM